VALAKARRVGALSFTGSLVQGFVFNDSVSNYFRRSVSPYELGLISVVLSSLDLLN
jgi:hypothetical protein